MELQNERPFEFKERAARKWMVRVLVVVVLIVLPALWFGPRRYSQWQQQRLLRQAQEYRAEGDVTRSAICLNRVLESNPQNLEGARRMADLLEACERGEALGFRERVCKLVPQSYPDAVAWARTAVHFGQASAAQDALDLMQTLGKPDAAFFEISARTSTLAGRSNEARVLFAKAVELAPASEEAQIETATLDIHSADPVLREEAEETLERLRKVPALHRATLSPLVAHRLEHGRISEAFALAGELVADPTATFQDRLIYLSVLREKEQPLAAFSHSLQEPGALSFGMLKTGRGVSFTSYLTELEAEARGDGKRAAQLIGFLNGHGLALLASEWAGTLPAAMTATPPVAPALADAYRLTPNWTKFEQFISGQPWGNFEFIRAAYTARLAEQKGDRATQLAQWASAVRQTEFRSERVSTLGSIALAWGWTGEWEDLLWTSVERSKRPHEALLAMASHFEAQRETTKLYHVWARALELDPADPVARKKRAHLALLLGLDRAGTQRLVQELYEKEPADPDLACAYGLVLHAQLQDKAALAVMERLPMAIQNRPKVSAYHGILLAAVGRKADAMEALNRAKQAVLFREEQDLVNLALRSLR